MKEAAIEICSLDNSKKISSVTKGIVLSQKQATSYDYKWEYVSITKWDKIDDKEVKQCKRQVDQYTLDVIFVRRFKSIKAADEEVRIGQNCNQDNLQISYGNTYK